MISADQAGDVPITVNLVAPKAPTYQVASLSPFVVPQLRDLEWSAIPQAPWATSSFWRNDEISPVVADTTIVSSSTIDLGFNIDLASGRNELSAAYGLTKETIRRLVSATTAERPITKTVRLQLNGVQTEFVVTELADYREQLNAFILNAAMVAVGIAAVFARAVGLWQPYLTAAKCWSFEIGQRGLNGGPLVHLARVRADKSITSDSELEPAAFAALHLAIAGTQCALARA